MAPATFSLFPNLPEELRREIWKCAAVDSQHAGVFFFDVSDPPDGPRRGDEIDIQKYRYDPWQKRYNLSPVYPANSGQMLVRLSALAPASSNFSSNSPLWTACKESRDVLRLYMKHPEENPFTEECEYTKRSGERHRFYVCNDDLVCLLPTGHDNIELIEDRLAFPFMDHDNVAFDYDATWENALGSESWQDDYPECAAVVSLGLQQNNMWFIDRRLVRTASPGRARRRVRRNRQVFQGKGYRLVEVRRGDDEWQYNDGMWLEEAHGRAHDFVFWLFDKVHEELRDIFKNRLAPDDDDDLDMDGSEGSDGSDDSDVDSVEYIGAQFGILAFERTS